MDFSNALNFFLMVVRGLVSHAVLSTRIEHTTRQSPVNPQEETTKEQITMIHYAQVFNKLYRALSDYETL